MEVHLTPAQNEFVQSAIRSGRYRSTEEVVREALAGWEERERLRRDLLAGIGRAESDLDSGQYHDYDHDSSGVLKAELNSEGRLLLAAKRAAASQR